MPRLSVNINKVATLRNARGGNNPDVVKVALDCERFGAQGITVHPRPDERHIRYRDVLDLKQVLTTEFNIEGYPDDRYLELVDRVRPAQATLVPDGPHVITSNAGWDTVAQAEFLSDTIEKIKNWGVRVSVFVNPDVAMVTGAKTVGADRIELYTGPFAAVVSQFGLEHSQSLAQLATYRMAADHARALGLGVNAGHDLDRVNLRLFRQIPAIAEVSIGHALVADALQLGLEATVRAYCALLDPA